MEAQRQEIEEEDSTWCSEATSQHPVTSAEWAEMKVQTAGTEDEWPLERSLQLSKWRSSTVSMKDLLEEGEEQKELEEPAVEPNSVEELLDRVVAEVEKIIAEQHATPIASSTVDFDCGESTSAEESKTTELSVADILSE
ncbi:hypothetical protein AXG93_3661s1210 [Marchantia polymorpha subsp. ruderalis]|uniref:Uncharacterized protein n=1 Tax=Marchantia polymorpha subsp. ruderalis TaxID=1480154 RepID=A0A176VMT7_MARPO|nr:hypothetical protein AXG93_3661s1210 [Marchantia polymorpha subsp. ruderalis]